MVFKTYWSALFYLVSNNLNQDTGVDDNRIYPERPLRRPSQPRSAQGYTVRIGHSLLFRKSFLVALELGNGINIAVSVHGVII